MPSVVVVLLGRWLLCSPSALACWCCHREAVWHSLRCPRSSGALPAAALFGLALKWPSVGSGRGQWVATRGASVPPGLPLLQDLCGVSRASRACSGPRSSPKSLYTPGRGCTPLRGLAARPRWPGICPLHDLLDTQGTVLSRIWVRSDQGSPCPTSRVGVLPATRPSPAPARHLVRLWTSKL